MCYRFVYITTDQVQEFGTAKTKFAGTHSSQKVQTVRLGTIIDSQIMPILDNVLSRKAVKDQLFMGTLQTDSAGLAMLVMLRP